MKKGLFCLLAAVILTGCNGPMMIHSSVPIYPSHPLKLSSTDKVLVGSRYDIQKQSYRKNKEELFTKIIDKSIDDIAYVVKQNSPAEVETLHGLTPIATNGDSTVEGIMASSGANYAILISSYDAYFDQTDVEVTKDEHGKSRTASYDIVVDSRYQFWQHGKLDCDTTITVRRFHSSRSVLSGLLAAGPNIVSNDDDAKASTQANVDLFMRTFFQLQEDRMRPLFVKKDFEKVGAAIERADFDAAFAESEKLISSKDLQLKSKGYYNCAVLLERKGDYEKAKAYLDEALNIYPLPHARDMMFDYRYQERN